MDGYPEISHYIAWQLERVKYIGLLLQILGLFMFLSLWWHSDRGWRYIRWFLCVYFLIVLFVPYMTWLIYALVSDFPTPEMRVHLLRSGAGGIILCSVSIIFLIIDHFKNFTKFDSFGPESWNSRNPTARQWFGLVIAVLAIWYPFVPMPLNPGFSLYTYGFPTSFGVTLTPVFLFLGGLILAGSLRPGYQAVTWAGVSVIISAMFVDPLTIHGILSALLGLAILILGVTVCRKQHVYDSNLVQ